MIYLCYDGFDRLPAGETFRNVALAAALSPGKHFVKGSHRNSEYGTCSELVQIVYTQGGYRPIRNSEPFRLVRLG